MLIGPISRRGWAIFFARAVLGLIFFMAGTWKVFVLTPAGHVRRFFLPFEHTFLPLWSLWTVGSVIPFVELIAGALVLIGLFRKPACVALGIVLITVTFGHLLENPLYALHEHVIPRLALLLFVLVMPAEDDALALDEILTRQRAKRGTINLSNG
jgi:uncharacterized membrane protein YphA (DoxX/SURF4 family)